MEKEVEKAADSAAEKLKEEIGRMIYEYTDYQEIGIEWDNMDSSDRDHFIAIAERINALVCNLARSSLGRPTTATNG